MDKLLKLLDTNARLTNAQLAVMAGMTEQAVADQLAAWERDGVIRGYKAVIDWDKTDRAYVTAIIELRVTPKRDKGFDGIAETILKFDEVESVSLLSGGYDFSIVVAGKSFQEVAMFVARRLSPMDSVISTTTHFMLRRYKQDGLLFLDEPQDERGAVD